MKNQFKKSLSLIMAVLMLMSCWVWVAPTDAKAATQNYTVKIKYQITNECEGGGHIQVKYWNFNADGTVNTGSSETYTVVNSLQNMAETTYEPVVEVPGFPYQVLIKTVSVSAKNSYVALQAVTIGDRVVTNDFDNYEVKNAEKTLGIDANGNKSGDMWGNFTPDWPFPKFGLDESKSTTSLDITTIPGSATASFAFKDVNYNEAWPHTVTQNDPSIVLQKDSATKTGMSASKGTGNTTTVTASTGADRHNPGNEDSSWKLKASFKSGGVTVTPEVDVTLTHPQYSITFDANGAKKLEAETITGVYGAKMDTYFDTYDYPGHKLSGYSTSQTGGTILDATTFPETTITGDAKYYARWEAADVDVVFLTADGQTVCTFTGSDGAKYGKTLLGHYGSIDAINNKIYNNAVGFAFNGNTLAWSKDGIEYEFVGWRIIDAWDLDGNKITSLNGLMYNDANAKLEGKTAFQATYKPASMKNYTVKFFGIDGKQIAGAGGTYTYGQDIDNLPADPALAENAKYKYEFAGWAKRASENGSKYYTVDENGLDEDGFQVLYVSDNTKYFAVEGDAEYVPVFKRIYKEYEITYKYYETDANGNTDEKSVVVEGVHYDAKLEAPEDVTKTYTTAGSRYNFSHWEVKNSADATGPKLEDSTCTGNMTVWMTYAEPIPAVYTINFYDYSGKLINEGKNEYTHGSTVNVPTHGDGVDADGKEFDIPDHIDTDIALHTFERFATKSGGGVVITAGADANYYAKYTDQYYAKVTYYNEGTVVNNTNDKEYFIGATIPEYNVIPKKDEDDKGTYTFKGWYDKSGVKYTPGSSTFETANIELFAEYDITYKNYTVKFMNEDKVVSEETYHYGDPIVVPSEEPTKAADESYTYSFIAWSPDVDEVCYGNATYTANYRKTIKLYPVTWFEDDAKTSHLESQYAYGAKIQPAVMSSPKHAADLDAGYTYAFKAWVQCNVNGQPIDTEGEAVEIPDTITDPEEQQKYILEKAVTFSRGMKMVADHLYFYPVFEKAEKTYTIEFYNAADKKVGETTAKFNADFAEIAEGFKKDATTEANDEYHYNFTNWVRLDNQEFTVNEDGIVIVDGNMQVKAECEPEAHNKVIYNVIKAPTCTETGIVDKKCAAESCNEIDYDVIEPMIADESVPTGKIYIGSDKVIDGVKYVGPNTSIIVSAEDTGTRSRPWNVEGTLSRGVGKIDYHIYEVPEDNKDEVIDATGITAWTNVYDYAAVYSGVLADVLLKHGITEADYNDLAFGNATLKNKIDDEVKSIVATYKANATGIFSNLELDNGKEYIIYIRISDREVNGECNVAYFDTGKVCYGTEAPKISVNGAGVGSKFCKEVTVTVTDDTAGYDVYLDGEAVENATVEEGKTTFTIKNEDSNKPSVTYTVSVVDANGNKTTKIFEIKNNHSYRNYRIAATCEDAGSTYDICTVCGEKANEDVIEATGHSYTKIYTEKKATCVTDGYRTYTCDNNCGITLKLLPTDTAETIAQAKKWNATAGEDGKGAYADDLTAADLAHLKATGKHTYAMVKDENGEDTDKYVWIIEKEPTCVIEGSQYRDCTVCGDPEARKTENIPVDTVNGHKLSYRKLTKPATCTEKGEKTQYCKNAGCDYVDIKYIDALGHNTEYVITTEATCTSVGYKQLQCSTCEEYVGDPVEIPVLAHNWKVEGSVYSVEETDENGETVTVYYQDYKCSGCGEIDSRILPDHKPPVAATVTFEFGTDKAAQIIGKYVGETIAFGDVEAATKASDKTYTYKFSHWKDENGNEVKFPFVVEGDATFYAVYTEKQINYTITYYKEDGETEFKKNGYLMNGKEVDLADGPTKAATNLETFNFVGWIVKGTSPAVVITTNKVIIDGADIELIAKYEAVKKQFAVTYAYSKSDILETFAVEAGSIARPCMITPVKDYDSNYHYTFKVWNKADKNTGKITVESNIYTTPEWNAIPHNYEHEGGKVLKSAAKCGVDEVYTYTCTCGYTYEEAKPNTALNHIWVDDETEGSNIRRCSREGCDAEESTTKEYTVKFYINADDTKPIKTINNVVVNTVIEASRLPGDPEKATTATTIYEFAGWALKGETEIVDFAEFKVTEDCEFVAVFTETTRKYSVHFGYDANNIIVTYKDVPAGSDVTYTEGIVPSKNYDDNNHYTFKGWKGYEAGVLNVTVKNIQEDTNVYADFTRIKHVYDLDNPEIIEPTSCGVKPGFKYTCECGHSYTLEDGDPLAHTWEVIETVEPSNGKDGYIKSKCKVCDEEMTETKKWQDNTITLSVKVLCNGAAQEKVSVRFVEKLATGTEFFATTGKDGTATFKVEDTGVEYACYVVIDGVEVEVTNFKQAANGNYSGTYSYEVAEADCSCACHRSNIWGSIFRFFHKLIKLVTGEFKCCENPDPMYG